MVTVQPLAENAPFVRICGPHRDKNKSSKRIPHCQPHGEHFGHHSLEWLYLLLVQPVDRYHIFSLLSVGNCVCVYVCVGGVAVYLYHKIQVRSS